MKKAFRVLTAALLAVQSMTSLHTVQADTKMESDRITIENGTFMYEGEPFISIGATEYGRLSSSYAHIEQSISDMAAHGLNTLRMCDYLENVYNTQNLSDYRDEALWTQIDFMLYQAEQYGMKVILDLSTFRSFFFRHGIDPYAESTYPLWEEAVEFVTSRKNTFTEELYKDDTTIFCYAIMGEPVVYSTEDVFDVENELASRSPLVVSNAILHVAQQLEIHSPDILVQSGGLLHFPRSEDLKIDGAYYWDYLLASEYIDFASVHIYPDQSNMFDAEGNLIEENTGEWLHLSEYVQSAKAVNKPLLVEEYGYNRNLDNASDDARAAYYRYAFETVWQNTDGEVGTGEINRCDITIFGQTARGECHLLIDNIRLIAVDVPNGDVNADGQFTVADVVLLQKWLLAVPGTALQDWKAGNFCRDDGLDAFDLCLMKRRLIYDAANSH